MVSLTKDYEIQTRIKEIKSNKDESFLTNFLYAN
jgi:hypothetical protein